ncbi:MAG: prenyltransferase, partial [Elusimicrobiota bacterium]|nr:prenyltransferase [Elusimicrobiota bacterium]
MKGLKNWILATRPQFLILSVVLAFLGAAIAWYDGYSNIWHALLAGIGLVFAHAAVNLFNDYFDFRSGIDKVTRRTPFSGGSGILPAGLLAPRQVLCLAILSLLFAIVIGVYFTLVRGWQLIPLLIAAAFLILFYSPFILKQPWPELSAGIGLGPSP